MGGPATTPTTRRRPRAVPPAETTPTRGPGRVHRGRDGLASRPSAARSSPVATVLDSQAAVDEFTAQFEDERMGEPLNAEVAAPTYRTADARRGGRRVGCDAPERGLRRGHRRGVEITGGKVTRRHAVPGAGDDRRAGAGRLRGGVRLSRPVVGTSRRWRRRRSAATPSEGVFSTWATVATPPDQRRRAAAVEVEAVLGPELLEQPGLLDQRVAAAGLDRPSTTSSRIRPPSRSIPTAVRGCSSLSFSTWISRSRSSTFSPLIANGGRPASPS